MNNYQKDLDKIIEDINDRSLRPKLLLHACCGPCSSYVLEYLSKYFQITVFYYNPNIYPKEEYERRFAELRALYERFPPALEGKVQVIEEKYDPEEFYTAVGTREQPELADEPERGERCRRCYEFRLRRAYEYAALHQFDYFCTTLSISPFKDAEKINIIGKTLESERSVSCKNQTESLSERTVTSKIQDNTLGEHSFTFPRWLTSDFKKKGGFKRSLEISEEYGMYRQQYCGCIYSMKNIKN